MLALKKFDFNATYLVKGTSAYAPEHACHRVRRLRLPSTHHSRRTYNLVLGCNHLTFWIMTLNYFRFKAPDVDFGLYSCQILAGLVCASLSATDVAVLAVASLRSALVCLLALPCCLVSTPDPVLS